MNIKKVPMRVCIGCEESKPKKELIRILHTPEGEFIIDVTGKKNGRGAYVCCSKDCFIKLQKSKGLDRAFKMPVSKDIYDTLLKEMIEVEEKQ